MSRIRKAVVGVSLLAVLAAVSSHVPTTAQAPPPGYANFEGSQTNPIRLSADGKTLFAVNTANASLSIFDVSAPAHPVLTAEVPVGVEPVSVNPRTKDEIWVVNQVSNSISIVSVSKGIVTDTVNLLPSSQTGTPLAEPLDVVFAGQFAFVSISRSNMISVLNQTSHEMVEAIPVFGGSPRAMTVSPDGRTVYAAFGMAGNATTLIESSLAPPQSPPTNPNLPPPPQVGLIVSATDPNWTKYIPYQMPANGVVALTTTGIPVISQYYTGVGTVNLGIAANPITGDLFVANTDALNLIHFETNLLSHFVNNRVTRITVATGQVTPFDLNPTIDYNMLPNPGALSTALAQPTNVVFDPSGAFMYVAAFGTDRVAKVDTSGNVLSFTEVSLPSGSGSNADPANKRGPRGLALNSSLSTLYCLNRISNTISVIHTTEGAVTSEIPVGNDPTPAAIKAGRGFLYDAKLSGNGTGSCAGCHVDGDMDHLAWDLGNPAGDLATTTQNGKLIVFHPMKGPMTTQTLRGLSNLSPYHWRGDKVNFQAFNAAFPGLMGAPSISSADMDTYTNFINTVLYLPNPNQNLDRTMPSSIAGGFPNAGRQDYVQLQKTGAHNKTCNSCHLATPGPGSNRVIDTNKSQPIKMPQLRNVYQKTLFNKYAPSTIDGFGLDHDGNSSAFVSFFADAAFKKYNSREKNDIVAYLMCFDTGTAPAVGYTITAKKSNVSSSTVKTGWATLQSQATAGNIDLIGRGTIQGQVHGLLYQVASNNYISDTGTLYTQAQLETLLQGTDTISFIGVFPGTGSAARVRR